jgi:HEAT repeat protein
LYSYYPDKCPAEWVDVLFADLKQAVRPPEPFQRLLADLNDDDFAVRERATAELVRLGPEIGSFLWAAPLDKLSAEAASRLQRVRANIEKPEIPPVCRRAISHFGWIPTPQDRKLLDAIAKTDCPNLISNAARGAIDGAKKR